jgi:hypothetical protein
MAWGRWRREVSTVDGVLWRVRIRWLPRAPRWVGWGFRGRAPRRERDATSSSSEGWDFWDVTGIGEGCVDDLFVALALFVILVVAWFVVLPALVFALDVLLVIVIAAAAVAARVLLRRPWVLDAESRGQRYEWLVIGWRASRQAVDRIAFLLSQGMPIDQVKPPGTVAGSISR